MTRVPLALLVVVGAGQVLLAANALAEAAKPLTEELPAAAQQATEDDGPQPATLTVGAREMGAVAMSVGIDLSAVSSLHMLAHHAARSIS